MFLISKRVTFLKYGYKQNIYAENTSNQPLAYTLYNAILRGT